MERHGSGGSGCRQFAHLSLDAIPEVLRRRFCEAKGEHIIGRDAFLDQCSEAGNQTRRLASARSGKALPVTLSCGHHFSLLVVQGDLFRASFLWGHG
jgi:hypothetical protein